MRLPISVDKTDSGNIVKRANVGERGYAANTEFFLVFQVTADGVFVEYQGEDDRFLDDEEVLFIIENRDKL